MFQNRQEAGLLLANRLKDFQDKKDTIVLAIPRGGVVVGKVISSKLGIPFSVIVVKKLGAPSNPELAIGAVAPNGVKVIDAELALRLGVEQEYLDRLIKEKTEEVEERMKKYQVSRPKADFKTTIVVDDGVATGATIRVAIKFIKTSNLNPTIILAVPVIARDTYDRIKSEVDKIIALEISDSFGAVGQFYREFPQVTDEEVVKYLK